GPTKIRASLADASGYEVLIWFEESPSPRLLRGARQRQAPIFLLLRRDVVKLFGLGEQRLEILDPPFVAGMGGQQLGRLSAAAGRFHPPPEIDSLARIVPGGRHEDQSNPIGLGFVLATEGQEHAQPPAGPENAEDF